MGLREVYDECFADPDYCAVPDEPRYEFARTCLREWDGVDDVIDIGAGRGHFLRTLDLEDVSAADLRDYGEGGYPFYEYDISRPQDSIGLWGAATCLDVLEHLPREFVPTAIDNLRMCSNKLVVTVANHSDVHHGVELHLTQEGEAFWMRKIERRFKVVAIQRVPNGYFFKCEGKPL